MMRKDREDNCEKAKNSTQQFIELQKRWAEGLVFRHFRCLRMTIDGVMIVACMSSMRQVVIKGTAVSSRAAAALLLFSAELGANLLGACAKAAQGPQIDVEPCRI